MHFVENGNKKCLFTNINYDVLRAKHAYVLARLLRTLVPDFNGGTHFCSAHCNCDKVVSIYTHFYYLLTS